jgi:class 3 adenylate cyclase
MSSPASCPTCGAARDDQQRSCAECGTPFELLCGVCGTVNPASHRYCSECGSPLDAAGPTASATRPAVPVRHERRLVTVLFADLVGFTGLSEDRDPEDVRAVVTRYYERATETLHRFGGMVDKFIGDAVMAVWGAVEAHEDDAERAVRAALELIDTVEALGAELELPLAARVGVLTGEASVGPGGNDRGLVVGDLVNTASRVQSLAEPGTVLVGESTYLAVGEAVAFDHAGLRAVRGRAEPVNTYRAVRVVSVRGTGGRGDTLEPPFVGRDEELRLLKDQLHAVTRERRARLISIVGEPGMGKNRLVRELRRHADGISDAVLWHHGRSPSYGHSLALWPVAEMVRSRVGIGDADDAAKSRLKLRTAVADLIPSESDQRWLEPRLAGLLGLDDGGSNDRNELFAALRTFIHAVASHGTVVLVFEDLHQAEPSTLDFIVELVERSRTHPILIVALARPDLLQRVPEWGTARHNTLLLHLAPLSDDAMRRLIAGTVPGLPDTATESMVARAGGIPLYAVEFIRMLLASGEIVREGAGYRLVGDLGHIAVPDSLQSVIGARLDRLTPAERDLVQDASVLGLAFFVDGLHAIRDESHDVLRRRLDDLVRKELFAFEEDPRAPGGGRFRFVQNLIKEVAYGRMSRDDRHAKHLRVAEHLESLGEIELAGKVANHYLLAFESAPRPEAERFVQRACEALCTAAARAASLQAHPQALRLWEQAIAITGDVAERARLHEMAAASADRAADHAVGIDHADRAMVAYEGLGDDDGRLRSATIKASILDSAYQAPAAVALLEPLVGSSLGGTATRIALELEYARALMLTHDFARSAEIAERALASAHGVVQPAIIVDGIITRGTALASLGRELEAAVMLQGATVLADEHQLHTQAMRALNNLAVIVAFDSPRRSGELAMEMLERGRQFADLPWLYRAQSHAADKLMAEGRFDDALAMLREVDLDSLPDFWQRLYRLQFTFEEIYRRPSEEAFERARRILASWEGSDGPQLRTMVLAGLASIELLAGEPGLAFSYATDADHDAEILAVAVTSAIWSKRTQNVETALGLIDGLPTSGRLTSALRMSLVATLDALEGRMPDAVAGFTAAIDILDAVGVGMDRAQMRAAFAAVVGPDEEQAEAASRAALEWIDSVGAVQLKRAWADGLPLSSRASAVG